MSVQNYKRQLLTTGEIDQDIHYGPFGVNWWHFLNVKTNQKQICFPIRINMRIKIEINKKAFIIRVVHNTDVNNLTPGYVSELDTDSKIYQTPSEAINESYRKHFGGGRRFSGPSVLGFEDESIAEQLQVDVTFFPFRIYTANDISVFVASIGSSDQEEMNFAGSGYQSSLLCRYSGVVSLICQSILDEGCQINIYHNGNHVDTFTGKSPTDVWTKLPILKKFDGKELFGLCDQLVMQEIQNHRNRPYCKLCDWDNIEKMTFAFNKCLKKKISVTGLNWHQFFTKWKQQKTTVIEFTSHLASIYQADVQITDVMLRAWRRMMQKVGCTNI